MERHFCRAMLPPPGLPKFAGLTAGILLGLIATGCRTTPTPLSAGQGLVVKLAWEAQILLFVTA